VFAIPGSIHNPLARGCHALIRQGAKLVENANDIIEELAPLLAGLQAACEKDCNPQQNGRSKLDDEYYFLLDNMGFDPVAVDQLIERSGLTADAVSSMLLLLELEGYVSSAPGGRYCRTGKAVVNSPSPMPISGGDEEVCQKDPT
jgi:DNA processing protein